MFPSSSSETITEKDTSDDKDEVLDTVEDSEEKDNSNSNMVITEDNRNGTKEEAKEKGPFPYLYASQGSVVHFRGDAIVNAANEGCISGGGVDGAITRAGGRGLAKARQALPIIDGSSTRCYTGDAKITVGGNLNAEFCIHAVGPSYHSVRGDEEFDSLLSDAYTASMNRAKENNLKVIRSNGRSLVKRGWFYFGLGARCVCITITL